jgi:HNH endonuclease
MSKKLRAVQKFCAYCGQSNPAKLGVDHVIPLALGGSNDLSNLTVCCHRCNARKRDRLPTPSERDAAGVPVQLQLEGVRGGVAPRKVTRTDPASQAASRSLNVAGWPATAGHGRVSA